MGFDIFVGGYHQGECSPFSLDIVENAFASAITTRTHIRDRSFAWTVEYAVEHPEELPRTFLINGIEQAASVRDLAEIYVGLDNNPDRRLTHGLMVAGPAANLAFYESLLTILRTTDTALYWPGENSLVIGHEDMVEHLPTDMVNTLGEPCLVAEAQQIIERIKASH